MNVIYRFRYDLGLFLEPCFIKQVLNKLNLLSVMELRK